MSSPSFESDNTNLKKKHLCPFCALLPVRWGNTPLDDAMQFGHGVVVSLLQEYQRVYDDIDSLSNTDEQKAAFDTLKSIV